jgi:hypothetical protein
VHLLDGRHLDIIDQAARFIKYNLNEPFGGLQVVSSLLPFGYTLIAIQLVLTGDFFHPFLYEPDHVFAFDAKAWVTETYSFQALEDFDSSAVSSKYNPSLFLNLQSSDSSQGPSLAIFVVNCHSCTIYNYPNPGK